jgi:hypothetical protein
MLIISSIESYKLEREYVYELMFKEFLGIEYAVKYEERENICIKDKNNRASVFFPDLFFQIPKNEWLKPSSLPRQPLNICDTSEFNLQINLVSHNIPVIYGDKRVDQVINQDKIRLPIDIFGSIFFMLTRYEEIVKIERDNHDRFPATASLSFQENFLERPIVNEYVEIVWSCINKLWPNLKRKERRFQIKVSCDVDMPFDPMAHLLYQSTRTMAGDIFKRFNLKKALKTEKKCINQCFNINADPYYNIFDWMMDVCERAGVKNAFYFISDHPTKLDGRYTMNDWRIRILLRRIHNRGHEIGFHASYSTYKNFKQFQKEFEVLKEVCKKEKIVQQTWGGRQHYLRWSAPVTWQNWEDAGLNYDSTLNYAQHAGFRCGTCYEYPVFNLRTSQKLHLRERPLIVMDCSVIDIQYMNYGHTESAMKYIHMLKERCKQFGGNFTLLWHNSFFGYDEDKIIYQNLIFKQ